MQTFIIPKYELKNRWDPYYNLPRFKDLYEKLQKCPHHLSTLKQESSAIFSGTTPLSGGDAYTMHNGIPFIRSGDFSEDNIIDFSKVIRIKKEVHNGKMRSSQLRIGDVLIAIVGATIGKIGVYKYDSEANINQAICSIRLKKLNPYYVQAFYQTNVGQLLIEHIKRPVARANINLEEVGGLPIPLVDTDLQQKIVDAQKSAFLDKQKKEEEAIKVLLSIDEYLLSELGIERPSPTRTEIGRFFYTSHKEVTGKRLDPVAYSEQTRNIKQAIVNGKYSCSTLQSLIVHEAAGDWGVDVIDDYDSQTYSKCLVLRSTEFNLHHNIVIDNTKAKYRLISNKKLDYIDLQPNDLIIEKSGGSENQPVGRVAIITKDLFERDRLCYSNFVQKIRLDKNQVIPTYVCFFLRLVHNMKLTETMQSQTNGIRNLIMSEYYAQQIPLPPLEKQKEIITHIGTLYNRAKQLQQEATDIMTNAKQQIEQMILGE